MDVLDGDLKAVEASGFRQRDLCGKVAAKISSDAAKKNKSIWVRLGSDRNKRKNPNLSDHKIFFFLKSLAFQPTPVCSNIS